MRKFLLLALALSPILGMSASAAPVALDLLGGGLSILDSLVLIAVGLVLIGLIFICIAFLKSAPKEKELEIILGDNQPRDFFGNHNKDDEETEEAPDTYEDVAEDEIPDEDIPDEEIPQAEEVIDEPEETDNTSAEPQPDAEIQEEPDNTTDEDIAEDNDVDLSEEVVLEETVVYPKLILIDPQTNDFKILPLCGETTIGRKTTNDLVLIDDTISGLHCVILAEDDKAYVEDKGSTNGTYLNGERIFAKTEIKHGDMLTIGKQSFLINYHA